MKKLLSVCSFLLAASALAVESSNTFGILRVESAAFQTIVSVPWTDYDSITDRNITDVVKTANLTTGDNLYYYTSTGGYSMWTLGSDKTWKATTKVTNINGQKETIKAGVAAALKRGGAIILERQDTSNPFYLYGRFVSTEVSTPCVPNGLTLLASPLPRDTDLNDDCTWTGTINAGDRIYVPTETATITLQNIGGTWGVKTKKRVDGKVVETVSTEKATIPAGQGIWYQSAGGSPTVTWK